MSLLRVQTNLFEISGDGFDLRDSGTARLGMLVDRILQKPWLTVKRYFARLKPLKRRHHSGPLTTARGTGLFRKISLKANTEAGQGTIIQCAYSVVRLSALGDRLLLRRRSSLHRTLVRGTRLRKLRRSFEVQSTPYNSEC